MLHPDLRLEDPRPGDVFLVCSDGVHDVVTAEEMLACVAQVREDLDAVCERLIRLANERGGKDNSTVLIVSCEAPDSRA
jgi:protein phosphatase